MSFDNIPEELRALPQWVCWKTALRDGKTTKIPYQVRKRGEVEARTNNPETWSTFDFALNRITQHKDMDGIGFVFTKGDPFVGIDVDKITNGSPPPAGIEDLIDVLGTYAEVSPSGNGIHIIGRGLLPTDKTGRKELPIEAYHHTRFFTMTGAVLDGEVRPIINIQPIIDANWSSWFAQPDNPTAIPAPAVLVFATDEEWIAKIRESAQGSRFDALMRGEKEAYAGDQSAADLALCSMIAFWTQDRDQIARIFGQSALADRDKWRKRADYREMTISKALERSEFYTPPSATMSGVTIIRGKTAEGEDAQVFTFNPTDKGNSLRVLHHYGDSIRYCHLMKSWLVWNGKRWLMDQDDEIMRICMATGETIYQEADSVPSDELAKVLRKWAIATESERKLVAMSRLVQAQDSLKIKANELDADPMLLNVNNGVVNLNDGSFHPHERGDYLTKIAPVNYEPRATSPTWLAFLDRIFDGQQDVISYVQRALGYTLTGDITERSIFMLYGAGRNGKSTLVETVDRIMGDYSTPSSSDLITARKGDAKMPTDLARLLGIRFTMATETGEYSRLDEARVKYITGGDSIVAERKYQEPFSFDPQFKIWLSTNHQPNIRGIDEGIWDRIRLIPFTIRIPDHDVDRYLKDKLLREASGILNWLVEGCLAWQHDGLASAEPITTATREYRSSMDSIGAFLNEACVPDPLGSIPIGELYRLYETWAKESGEYASSKRALTNRLRDRGFIIEPVGKRKAITLLGMRLPFDTEYEPSPSMSYSRHNA